MKFNNRQNYIGAISILIFCMSVAVTVVFNQETTAKQPLGWLQKLRKRVKSKDEGTENNINRNLLTQNEISKFQFLIKQEIQTTLELAGLGKISEPPKLPTTLKAYRKTWSKVDPEIAPFLGLWVNDWEMFQPDVVIAIFPSTIKGQICVIAYQDNGHYYTPPPGGIFPHNPPPRFSTVKIVKGQAIANKLRIHKSLITQKGEIEFIGTVKGKSNLQLYASKSIANIDSQFSSQIIQQFKTNQCSTELPPNS